MMTAALTGGPVNGEARRRKQPLPGPFAPRVRVLPSERPRQLDPPGALAEVALMERSHPFEVLREVSLDHTREHRHAVPAVLAVSDRDVVRREVEVLDSQPATFQESGARHSGRSSAANGLPTGSLLDRAAESRNVVGLTLADRRYRELGHAGLGVELRLRQAFFRRAGDRILRE